MADQIFSVEGVEGIVNPTRWNAQNTPYGEGAWNTGGFTAQDVVVGWGHLSWGRANWGDLDIYEEGWGRSTWGNEPWGGTHNKNVLLTGLSATASVGSITPADQVMGLTGQAATGSVGTIAPADVMGINRCSGYRFCWIYYTSRNVCWINWS